MKLSVKVSVKISVLSIFQEIFVTACDMTCYSGTLGEDVPAMVNLFVNGRSFESIKESEAVAHITIAFGRVSISIF